MKPLTAAILSLTIVGSAVTTQAASFFWQRDCQGAPTATVSFMHHSQYENSYACLQQDYNVQSQPEIQKYILSYRYNGECTNTGGIPEFVNICRAIAPSQPEANVNTQQRASQQGRSEYRAPRTEYVPPRKQPAPEPQVDLSMSTPGFDAADLALIQSGKASLTLAKVHRDIRCNITKESATLYKNWTQNGEQRTRYSEEIPNWSALTHLVVRIGGTGFRLENTPERPTYGYGAQFPGGKSSGLSLRNSGGSSSASPETQSLVDFIELNCNF